MKFLFAIKRLESASGGAERVICTICSEIAARGHSVTLVTFDKPSSQPFYPLDKQVKRINLGIGNSGKSAHLKETICRIFSLRKLIFKEKPEIVIGFMHSMFLLLALSMLHIRIPLIGSEHIVPEHYKSRHFQFLLLIIASTFITKITVLSESIRIRYPYSIRRKMIVMPNPILSSQVITKPNIKKKRYTLLNVGRLDFQKDQATLIQAFARIALIYPQWDLRIIGEGPLRENLQKLICSLQLEHRIFMPGVTSKIESEYRNADIFTLSSRYESFGLATAEAMSYCLPIIGYEDCPGTNELVQHGKTGILVKSKPDKVLTFSKAIEYLITEPEQRSQLGNAGKKFISKYHSIQHVTDLWEALLKQLASQR